MESAIPNAALSRSNILYQEVVMKLLKRCALVALGATMALTMAGCGGNSDDAVITMFYNDLAAINTAMKKNSPSYQKYMKECGIEFRCLTTGGGDSETQLQKMFNVGELPDIFVHRTAENPKLYQKMIEDNAIVAISDYVSETKYPNIYRQIHKHDYLTSNIDFTNGKHYAIPTEFQQEHTFYVRLDWIDNLNKPEKLKKILVDEGYAASEGEVTSDMMEEHKFTTPDTLIEFHRLARAFTLYDPDENGQNDTYGYTSEGETNLYSDGWMYVTGGGYNVMQDSDGDGIYTYSGISDGNKYVVGFINRLLAEGYMDPSWVTDTVEGKNAKFTNGKVGMMESQIQIERFARDMSIIYQCSADEALAKIGTIAPPMGEDGSFGIQGHPGFWTSVYFSASMSEEKLERALTLMAYLLSDEAKEMTMMGVEGAHWEKTADGKYRSLCGQDEEGFNKTVYHVDSFSGMRVFNSITNYYYNPFLTYAERMREALDLAQTYNRYADYYMLTTPALTEYWSGMSDKMFSEFTLMVRDNNNVNQAVYSGQKVKDITWDNLVVYNDNFNTVWDSYVSNMNSSYHGKEIQDEYNAAVKDHGVKVVAPEVNMPRYEVVK